MEPRLRSTKAWIAQHSTALSATITILVGMFVIAVGISG
jgi:hypothetical protein